MKVNTETVYRCEHCDRPMFRKGSMTFHERTCKNNPNNKHKCFQYCAHLHREVTEAGDVHFYCQKTGNDMYSYKIEKYGDDPRKRYLTRMPLECEHYEDMGDAMEKEMNAMNFDDILNA